MGKDYEDLYSIDGYALQGAVQEGYPVTVVLVKNGTPLVNVTFESDQDAVVTALPGVSLDDMEFDREEVRTDMLKLLTLLKEGNVMDASGAPGERFKNSYEGSLQGWALLLLEGCRMHLAYQQAAAQSTNKRLMAAVAAAGRSWFTAWGEEYPLTLWGSSDLRGRGAKLEETAVRPVMAQGGAAGPLIALAYFPAVNASVKWDLSKENVVALYTPPVMG